MGYGQLIAVAGTMASILGIFLTIYGVINNRTLRETSRHTEQLISTMDREHREILLRIDSGQQEARREMAEARKEMAEARKEMAEAIKYLAGLIRMEGEKTREAIRTPS